MARISRRNAMIAGAGVATAILAGCSGDGGGDDDPADRGPIAVTELALAAERPAGYDDYELQPDATYESDEKVWLYAELSGLSGVPAEDGDSTMVDIDLVQTVTVEGPAGNVLVDSTQRFERTLDVRQLDAFFVGTDVVLSGTVATGTYAATLAYTDQVSQTETTESATFSIEA